MTVKQWNDTKWIALILVLLILALGLNGCVRSESRLPETGPVFTEHAPEPASTGAPVLAAPQEIAPSPLPSTSTPEPVQVEEAQAEAVVSADAPVETVNPEDPAYWDMGEGRPDPNNPAFTEFDLTEEQLQMALRPIRDFYNGMYHSDRLLTLEEASQMIDVNSPAWTDPRSGFQVSYNSFSEVGYYPRYEHAIDNPDYYTQWRITALKSPEGDFYVVVFFRFEEQGFTVYEESTGEVIVNTPYWGPRLLRFETAFRDDRWKITHRHDEDLGTKMTPTPAP
jgi:hypothetical protein